jgi:RNA polymerase sigma-70 factor (ECF subfamily)
VSDKFREELSALLPRLRRFALSLTADADRADDLVQAGCERALARQQQWQPGTRLDSWMYKIMQNLWIDQLRAKSEIVPAEPEEIEQVPGRDFNRGIEAQLTLEQVMAAMQKLPPQMRSVLALVCIEDLSYREAADTLGVPIGTVMSRLARARLELHRLLSGAAAGPGKEGDHAPLH